MNGDIVVISGGIDPLHGGHIDYIEQAVTYGKVIVLLNSDDWLKRKKGYVFMTWGERQKILLALRAVHSVFPVDDKDNTVIHGLSFIKLMYPDNKIYFAKGGDRGPDNTPEAAICAELGIEMLYEIGGGKTQSSSELVNHVRDVV